MGGSIKPEQQPKIKGFNDYLKESAGDTLSNLQTQKSDASNTQNRIPSYNDYVSQFGAPEGSQHSSFYNRFNNLYKLYKVSTGMASGDDYAEVGRAAVNAEGTMPGAWQKVGRDIINTLSYYGKKPPDPTRVPGPSLVETVRNIFTADGATAALAGIPEAFQSIITAPIEAVTGIGLDRDTLYGMTPEERAQSIKDTAANVAMFMVGGAAGKAVKGAAEASTATKLAKAASVAELRNVARTTAGGALKRAIVTGTLEAGAGGATQAALSRLGEEDVWNQIALNGILFAPLGAAFERIKYIGKSTDKLGQKTAAEAVQLAQTRQLQVSTKDSYSGIMYKLDGLETADNLAEAVLSGKLRATPDRPVVVPGVTSEQLPKLIASIARGETKVEPTFYQRPDGMFDMLVGDGNKLSPTARRSFSETGFVPNQLVEVNGRTYTFNSLSKDGTKVNLTNSLGRSVSKPRSEVRVRTEFETHDLTPQNSGEQVYRDFKNFAMKDVPGQPEGADFWDGTPTKSFDELLNTFAKERGFNEAETAVLERDLTQQLFNDTLRRLPPEERAVVDALHNEVEQTITQPGGSRLEQAQIAAKAASSDVVRKARTNGMYVDEEAAGNLVLRDAQSDHILGRFKTTKDAIKFIDESGQATGVDLDGGGPLPPWGSGLMPMAGEPSGIPSSSYLPLPNDTFADFITNSNLVVDWMTPNRNILLSLDNKFGTKFFSKVFDTTQVARMKANAVIRPWYERLKAVDEGLKGLSKAEREIVSGHLETMSPDEVKARGGQGGRPLNELEIKLGEAFAAQKVDLSKVQQFIREVDNIDKDLAAGRIDEATANNAKAQALQDRALSESELHAVDLVRQTKESKAAWFGSVARLANAILNKDVTRADYAKLHGMNAKQLRASMEIESMYKDLAKTFGISDEYRLENFMTHARLYSEGKISLALRDFDVPPAVKDFYAALARTQELASYEKDPVRALQRYIKAGFDSRIMAPAIEKARQVLDEELVKLPDEVRGKAKHVVSRYIDDVQGIPGQATKFTQFMVNDLLPKFGLKLPVDVRKDIVNLILQTGETAAQGFRVIAGVRDFYQGVSWYFARFGLERTLKMLEYGTKGLDGVTKADLIRGGLIPELGTIYFESPTDFTGTNLGKVSNVVGRGLRKVSQVGLAMSGQKNVYALLHAGSYLDTWKLSGETINQYARGEITKAAAYKKLSIDSYDIPVVAEFDRLVNANQIDQAAKFLARNTGAEQVGVFGSGNNPGGWNRNIGRLAGQFGSWPVWYRAQLTQMASRGSYGYRAAALTRLAATQGILLGAGAAAGVNLASWYAPSGLSYVGGPLVDFALTGAAALPGAAGVASGVADRVGLTGLSEALDTVNTAMGGDGFMQRMALARLRRYLPYDPVSEEFNIGQIYVPGSFFARDIAEAYQMARDGETGQAALRAIGLRPSQ